MKPALPWHFSTPSEGVPKAGCVVLFTLPFLIGGLFFFWSMAWRPASDWMRARSWQQADAVIERAWIETTTGRNKDSHKVAVRFHYQHEGAEHVGTRHSFVSTATSLGVSGMKQVVERLPAGTTVACWVNPANPGEAVLDRSLPVQAVLSLFFATSFIAVGFAGLSNLLIPSLRRSIFERRKAQLTRLVEGGKLPGWVLHPFNTEPGIPVNDVSLIIAADDRLPLAVGMTFYSLVGNSLVGAFVCADAILLASGDEGAGLILAVFLTPFVVAGIGMVWKSIKLWRLCWRAEWVAALRPAPGFEGGDVSFCWTWLDSPEVVHPPQATVRIVGQAAAWDDKSDSPRGATGSKRRTKLSDRRAAQQSELELAAVDVPIAEAGREIRLRLPPLPSPQLELAKTASGLPVVVWGGWWQLEVTYADGAIELGDLTKPEKFE